MALAKVKVRLANKIAKMQCLRNEGLCKHKLFKVNVFPEINRRGKVKNQPSLQKKKRHILSTQEKSPAQELCQTCIYKLRGQKVLWCHQPLDHGWGFVVSAIYSNRAANWMSRTKYGNVVNPKIVFFIREKSKSWKDTRWLLCTYLNHFSIIKY